MIAAQLCGMSAVTSGIPCRPATGARADRRLSGCSRRWGPDPGRGTVTDKFLSSCRFRDQPCNCRRWVASPRVARFYSLLMPVRMR